MIYKECDKCGGLFNENKLVSSLEVNNEVDDYGNSLSFCKHCAKSETK